MMTNGLFTENQHQPTLILIGGEAAPLALWQQLNAQPELLLITYMAQRNIRLILSEQN